MNSLIEKQNQSTDEMDGWNESHPSVRSNSKPNRSGWTNHLSTSRIKETDSWARTSAPDRTVGRHWWISILQKPAGMKSAWPLPGTTPLLRWTITGRPVVNANLTQRVRKKEEETFFATLPLSTPSPLINSTVKQINNSIISPVTGALLAG